MTGIITNAGVLEGGKLTAGAKQRFFQQIQDEISQGTGVGLGFPCGPEVDPIPHAEILDLTDETTYPELHKTWLEHYEAIANSLDIEGNTPLLPICDPTALAVMIGKNIDPIEFDEIVAMIALGPGISAKLIDIFGPSISTDLPNIIASLPVPPPVPVPKVPDPNLPDLGFNELFDFSLGMYEVPIKAFQATLGNVPSLIPNLTVNGVIELACKGVFDSLPSMESGSNIQQAAANVLGRETAKMTALTLMGSTFGNGLLVKGAGSAMGYDQPATPEETEAEDAPTGLYDFVGSGGALKDTSLEFQQKIVSVASNLGFDPNFLAAVMTLETGGTYSSTIENPSSKAVGLIQFTSFTISIMKTTRAALTAKTNVEQLDDVEAFYKLVTNNGARKINNVGDAYLAVFASDFIGRSSTSAVYTSPNQSYTQNSAFDTNGDGIITVGEITSKIQSIYDSAKSRGTIS